MRVLCARVGNRSFRPNAFMLSLMSLILAPATEQRLQEQLARSKYGGLDEWIAEASVPWTTQQEAALAAEIAT